MKMSSSVCLFLVILFLFDHLPDTASQHKKDNRVKEEKLRGVYNQIGSSPQACEESSCYPATGNLLIGREDKLHASSTCGLTETQRYCIVSHLKERKKCFFCNSNPSQKGNEKLYHGIENIVSRIGKKRKFWWQSQNGVENVSIQLDLEAEFHFTHLIITFKTFRPAAMLIERSHDFGRTWKVYQYFSYDCPDIFPHVPQGPRHQITDVVCDSHYSGVEPSTEGEVIFRVLPPNIRVNDPYSPAVQNLLKMTNLRINFTKLHTLGDNLLDKRGEIKEKYYYAIYDMVVRGSCSCYGHASSCIADGNQVFRQDMVYGKCQCTHNTKGLNCEQCADFYNDQPWRPAIGRQTNACKICNCNGHATRCHFDPAVWEATGRISGGVCDDCQHNTMGKSCEHCKPFFFEDPIRDFKDPNICQPCDCDPRGSLDDGICDSRTDPVLGNIAGSCHCKRNVEGWRCDRCKSGYWNFQSENSEGCEACTCNSLGTIDNQGCNSYTGECVCKRHVVGRDCNECLPEHWGLSTDEEGCKPCDCDPGGSFDNNCDLNTGQCPCRPHVNGRRCDLPESGYFVGSLDHLLYEAELAKGSVDCQVLVREPYSDRESSWTGLGFMRVFEGSTLEFNINDVPASLEYDIIIRFEPQTPAQWQEARVTIERPGPIDPTGECANTIPSRDDKKIISLPRDERHAVVIPTTCLEKGKNYKVIIEFKHYDREISTPSASVLIDSIVFLPRIDGIPFFEETLLGGYRRREYEHFRCGEAYYNVLRPVPDDVCKKYLYSIGFYVYGQAFECNCDPMGSTSTQCDSLGGQCTCKPHIVGRRCDHCAPGSYGFGPSGCRPCDCNSIGSLDNFCDMQSGQCKCRPNTYGRQCDECQPGFWNYPNCQRCDCNGHADTCDPHTGYCVDCRDYTAGPKCDRCEVNFYGDPRLGIDIPCRPCPCPGTVDSGINHARGCDLDSHTQNVICHCDIGYSGERCDHCADNYYGQPTQLGDECRQCECNNNIDIAEPGNCDTRTGECLRCLYNTDGHYCERCRPGFYGDATKQQCRECGCSILGTDPNGGHCNGITGQCPCLPNVEGLGCDQCIANHWKIASGKGCESCNCDHLGSYESQCNQFTGECSCREGYGGRMCDECETGFWGDPNIQCFSCKCNRDGSATTQCRRNNGTCVCIEGVAGDHCDQCARGFTGQSPYCESCGECFTNWDDIIQQLKERTLALIDAAQRIKQTGTTGAYTKEFEEMEQQLDEVRDILASANVTGSDIEELQGLVDQLRQNLTDSQKILDSLEAELENTTKRILDTGLALSELRRKTKDLQHDSKVMKDNATALQEANVEGALNITKEAQRRSRGAESEVRLAQGNLYKSESARGRTERLLGRTADHYNQTYLKNEEALNKTSDSITDLENQIPDINFLVCGGKTQINDCSDLCGGANCPTCGSVSCSKGAVSNARSALDLAKDSENLLRQNEKAARDLFASVKEAERDAEEALKEAKLAYERAKAAKEQSENATADIEVLLDNIDKFLETGKARPAEIRVLAEECLKLAISLRPEEILELAKQINNTIQSLTDIDAILEATKQDLAQAQGLKDRADLAKENADAILDTARQVLEALEKAKEAQGLAQDAIDKAKEDIKIAEADLAEIGSETTTAQDVANKSVEDIGALQGRLDPLKKRFAQNEINAKKAEHEADIALRLAEKADEDALELEEKYDDALNKLNDKAEVSGAAKDRAEKLRERARKLTENANSKLKELQEMEDEFDENERRLKNYSDILDQLNQEMMDHLNVIEERSNYYRKCQT